MSETHNGISIIIPAYNEAHGIGQVLEQVAAITDVLAETMQTEIIVVDDGSDDATSEEVKKSPRENITLLRHERNRGYGASIKSATRQALYDIICITDADATYPNEQIINLINTLREKNLDMVVGARIGSEAHIPLIRRPAKWVITMLARYLTETMIPDLNSGLRVMKKEVVEKFIKILPDGFSLTSTITIAMLTNGYRVEYIPINYYKRVGKSKIRPIHDTLNFTQLIIRTVMYFNPLKVFLPVSLPLILFGGLMIIFQAIYLRNISTVSVIISLGGIQLLAIGMLADLIDKRTS